MALKSKLKLKKTGSKKAAKAAKAAKETKPKFEVGKLIEFTGYADKSTKKVFTKGDKVYIGEVETVDGVLALTCIKIDDVPKFIEDAEDDSIRGQQLTESEVKKLPGFQSRYKEPEKPREVVNKGELAVLLKKDDVDLVELVERFKGEIDELGEKVKERFFYMGGVIAHLYYEKKYVEYGKKYADPKTGWDAFCEDKLGFKGRKAKYYADIYMNFIETDIDIKRIGEIGWSKAAEASRYITTDNAEEVVQLAEKTNIIDLKKALKAKFVDSKTGKTPSGRAGTRQSKTIKMVDFGPYRLFEDMAEGCKLIMQQAQKQLGHNSPTQTFEHILNEWALDHLGATVSQRAKASVEKRRKELKRAGVKLPGDEEGEDEGGEEAEAPKKGKLRLKRAA